MVTLVSKQFPTFLCLVISFPLLIIRIITIGIDYVKLIDFMAFVSIVIINMSRLALKTDDVGLSCLLNDSHLVLLSRQGKL